MPLRTRYLLIAGLALVGVVIAVVLAQSELARVQAPTVVNKSELPSAWGTSPFAVGTANQSVQSVRPHAFANSGPTVVIYGRNGRTIDFGGLDAATYIAQWGSRARMGDTEAAYKVFQAADVCANSTEEMPDFQSNSDRAEYLHERVALEKLCVGVTPAQVQERMSFLTLAARAGNTKAQIDFYMEGPYGRALNPTDGADDPAVVKWKEDAVSYLKTASTQGEPFALALLSSAYDVGELVPQDAKMALAYEVADATARNANLSPEQLRKRFGSQMSDADFTNALQLGAQIADNCCKKR
jgi:hypothetical protein